ncbi:MAG TPA: NAD(P)/FAD-dependent oxidoreductase [Xanthobacteraceae bacterium]
MKSKVPDVVIVGGGFAGLAAAKALRHSDANVTLIDRQNHHLFQPLLYQVATSVLTPGQIGSPLRAILGSHRNTRVITGEVYGIRTAERDVRSRSPEGRELCIKYDYLIVATGATHSYFGHPEFEQFAPGLKTLADAVSIRNKILRSLEEAEVADDPVSQAQLLTFVFVGAGPTGVELASALSILVRTTMRKCFRFVDPLKVRIILVDQADRVLGTFAPALSLAAKQRLVRLGVEVRLGHGVDAIDANGVTVNGEYIAAHTVIWAAGVTPSPAFKWLGAPSDRAGRVTIQPDLSVAGNPNVFVVGDTASLSVGGRPLPGVSQVAIQQGRYAAHCIDRNIRGNRPLPAFSYFDKGNMAVIGARYAILQSGRFKLKGLIAWFVWAAIHIQFLAQSYMRLTVFIQWSWTYITGQRGSALIVNHHCENSTTNKALQRDEHQHHTK